MTKAFRNFEHSYESLLKNIRDHVQTATAEHEELTIKIRAMEEDDKVLKKDIAYWSEIIALRSGQTIHTVKRSNKKFAETFAKDIEEFASLQGRFFKAGNFISWYKDKYGASINVGTVRTNILRCLKKGIVVSLRYNGSLINTFYGLSSWVENNGDKITFLTGYEPDPVDMLSISKADRSQDKIVWTQKKKEVPTAA